MILLGCGNQGREATAILCYFLPSSCEFVVDVHRCGYCPLSFSTAISPIPVLFFFFLSPLQNRLQFSKQWPFLLNLLNFVHAISKHKYILVDLTTSLKANCTPAHTGLQTIPYSSISEPYLSLNLPWCNSWNTPFEKSGKMNAGACYFHLL